MPHGMLALAFGGLTVLLAACAAPVDGSRSPVSFDAGVEMDLPAAVDEPPCDQPETELRCTLSYPPFLCEGRCGGGTLCCVTGARPLGVCRTLDGCVDQCAYDCGIVGQNEGPRAQALCEAMCVAVTPNVSCE